MNSQNKKSKKVGRTLRSVQANMGLALTGGYLCYGWGHGWIPWAPQWFKHAVVKVWNSIFCMVHGHDTILVDLYKVEAKEGNVDQQPPSCSRCCTELPVDGVYVRSKEPWWKKKPSKEEIAEWTAIAESPDPLEESPDPS